MAGHANEGMGYGVLHVVIDDHSRYAYVEQHADERGATCARFLERALAHFAELGIHDTAALMSDNARNYRTSGAFQAVSQAGADAKETCLCARRAHAASGRYGSSSTSA